MKIIQDELTGPEIKALLQQHRDNMAEISPPESIHALDLEALRALDITFWTIWENDQLLGCGALKQLDSTHAEIKSMRTDPQHRRKGVAKKMLQHILAHAQQKGYTRLSLETGSQPQFQPARDLYRTHGFEECDPFGDYTQDPNSIFMMKEMP